MRSLVLLIVAAASGAGELPEMYRRVDRLLWVVDDAGCTAAGWKGLGIAPDAAVVRDDAKLNIRYASARFGDISADFIQPLGGVGPFADFRTRRGAGVMAVLH